MSNNDDPQKENHAKKILPLTNAHHIVKLHTQTSIFIQFNIIIIMIWFYDSPQCKHVPQTMRNKNDESLTHEETNALAR